ncbi:ribosome silencing factor [Alteraurantiacibacter aquimixticola]
MTQAQAIPATTGTATIISMTDNPETIHAEPGSLHALVLQQLDDDQAQDVISIPLEGKSSIADHMIVASGRSTRQVASIATKLAEVVKKAGFGSPRVEGLPAADWVLIDAGDVVVHLFRPEVRSFYNLERMWGFGEDGAKAAAGTA